VLVPVVEGMRMRRGETAWAEAEAEEEGQPGGWVQLYNTNARPWGLDPRLVNDNKRQAVKRRAYACVCV